VGVAAGEVVGLLLRSWPAACASAAVACSHDPAAGTGIASPPERRPSACAAGWLAAPVDTLSFGIVPGWCRGPSCETLDRGEDLGGRVRDMIQPCRLDPALTHDLDAHSALEGSSMLNLRSDFASAHCGSGHPLAVPHGWYVGAGSVASPLARMVGHRLREDQPVHKDLVGGSD
jgi:hypothetical protein